MLIWIILSSFVFFVHYVLSGTFSGYHQFTHYITLSWQVFKELSIFFLLIFHFDQLVKVIFLTIGYFHIQIKYLKEHKKTKQAHTHNHKV